MRKLQTRFRQMMLQLNRRIVPQPPACELQSETKLVVLARFERRAGAAREQKTEAVFFQVAKRGCPHRQARAEQVLDFASTLALRADGVGRCVLREPVRE